MFSSVMIIVWPVDWSYLSGGMISCVIVRTLNLLQVLSCLLHSDSFMISPILGTLIRSQVMWSFCPKSPVSLTVVMWYYIWDVGCVKLVC